VELAPSVSVHATRAEPEAAASASVLPPPSLSPSRGRPAQRTVPVPSASQRLPTDLLRERE
jgi:hypothetical protein